MREAFFEVSERELAHRACVRSAAADLAGLAVAAPLGCVCVAGGTRTRPRVAWRCQGLRAGLVDAVGALRGVVVTRSGCEMPSRRRAQSL
jgi:hypothetical protein